MATRSKLRPVYAAITALGARAHISRFDADGAVMFFTLDRPEQLAAAETAAQAAGAWLLGARATKLDSYLRALRAALDPDDVMNPGTLA